MYKYFLILLVIIFNGCSAQTNFNGGFEKIDPKTSQPLGWTYGFNKDQAFDYPTKLDNLIKKEGKYSVSIEKKDKTNIDYGVISYVIPARFKGNTIQLTAYIKTQSVANGYAGLWLRLEGEDRRVIRLNNMEKQGVTGTNDWKPYTITLEYDENIKQIYFGGLLVGDGKTWFDDFQLSIDGKKIESLKPSVLAKAETDTEFDKGSSIPSFNPNAQQITNLAVTAQFWGFLKYHHPSVASGNYNWDAELFRLLPSVINAKNNTELSIALELFLDKLPKVAKCNSCSHRTEISLLMPNYGELLTGKVLSVALTEKISFILKNASIKENYYISMTPGVGNPKFQNEKAYATMKYPDAGFRLLSLYRYWNMINYFFPYKNQIDEDWNKVLYDFIPQFIAAKSETEYNIVALSLIAKISDTHANLWNSNGALDNYKGKNTTPFKAKFIENKLLVTGFYLDTLDIKNKIKIGDEILAINGEKVNDLIKKFLPLTAASNYDTQLRDLPSNFLLRSNNNTIKLDLKNIDKAFELDVPMVKITYSYKNIDYTKPEGHFLINDQIGYVYPAKYKNAMLPDIKKLFENTKGIVIDMRCYPSEFMPFTFGHYIKSNKTPFVKFSVGQVSHPGTFIMGTSIENGGNKDAYKGNVIVIVNSESQSQAEYTTMAFQSSPNVKVIGSQTAGADGNVSTIVLPGGISSWISGIGVFYPDGKPTQRVGVSIDYPIKPTVNGIRNGKDELLEKAIQLLEKGW